VVNFSRNVEKCWCHFYQGFLQTQLMFLFDNISCFGIKSHISKIMSNCWNDIREMSVFESIFEIQAFVVKDLTQLLWSKTQHTLFNVVLWLSCILKTEMTHCKAKMNFFMVLCVSFNLWSWVYLLMVCDEMTFCEFQKTRCSNQNLRLYQERLFSFLGTNFISMHNNK